MREETDVDSKISQFWIRFFSNSSLMEVERI